ncbi:MAG TPA: helix-turn-helix transcriptional regulator [Myxococcales bacterium]|nr:helix-turn-helix transcriptional regulator [Myxococcales bacterium]
MTDELDPEQLLVDTAFLERCRRAAHLNQKELGTVLGLSERTMSRWMNGGGGLLMAHHYQALARAIFRHDPAFAGELAAKGGATLDRLGLLPPAALSGSPLAGSLPAAAAAAPSRGPADALLLAVCERLDLSPRHVRPLLAVAFARARELGLSTEALAHAFAADLPPG